MILPIMVYFLEVILYVISSTAFKVTNNPRPNYNRDQAEFLLIIKANLLHRN